MMAYCKKESNGKWTAVIETFDGDNKAIRSGIPNEIFALELAEAAQRAYNLGRKDEKERLIGILASA